jgi:uncharacterized SAM-binding protein YcdF (DUF218 family)
MQTARSDIQDGGAPPVQARPHLPRLLCRLGKSGLLACIAAGLGLLAGFLWFIGRVPAMETELSHDADAIVVLTGGASRISDAIELLASGRGKRLLISGAFPRTNSNEISRLNPEHEQWVRCCVDFDRAVNTLGNALEIKRWVENRGFRSLIVVTSNYHMPRALFEIRHQLPEVALLPFPVITDRQRLEPWWTNGVIARRMVSEYVKLIFAHIRTGLQPVAGSGELG